MIFLFLLLFFIIVIILLFLVCKFEEFVKCFLWLRDELVKVMFVFEDCFIDVFGLLYFMGLVNEFIFGIFMFIL